jgi:hypothetical protein
MSGTADELLSPPFVDVERLALNCTATSQCAGGQSCCNGVCQNLVSLGADGRLAYGCYAARADGGIAPSDNIIPDFSFAGYKMGGVEIPTPTIGISNLQPIGNEASDSANIQSWLDWCAGNSSPCQVKLAAANFFIDAPLLIRSNNVVLRGAGQGPAGTDLISRIHGAHSVVIIGPEDPPSYPEEISGTQAPIIQRAPVGTKEIVVSGGGPWHECSTSNPCDVVVVRTPNARWVTDIGMRNLGSQDPDWDPVDFVAPHPRRVVGAVAVSGGTKLTIDIPLVDAIDPTYGGGTGATGISPFPGYVAKINDGGFVEGSGVDNLRIWAFDSDNAPEICSDGAQCACAKDGDPCKANSHCGGATCAAEDRSCTGLACSSSSQCGGGTCQNNKCSGGTCGTCRCECDDSAREPCFVDCPDGLECRAGVCRCPSESGVCSNGQPCLLKDGNWSAIRLIRARNSWVRRVTVYDYGMSAVHMSGMSSFNTVEEVAHLDPRSPIDPDSGLPNSGHRYSFQPGDGIGNLFQRCFARDARHSFVTGSLATGPHVWLDSVAIEANADQGPHFKWATGLLFDNIYNHESVLATQVFPNGGGVRVHNAHNGGTSHGWTGAQVMIWNSESALVADAPVGAMNWVVGGIGVKNESTKTPSEPFGIWQFSHTTVKPRSLYLQQLRDRKGQAALEAVTTPQQRNGRLTAAMLRWQGQGKLADFQDDPTCASGTPDTNSGACCPSTCAECGGSGLPEECRAGPILSGTRSCLEVGPPCFRPDPTCRWGKSSSTHCCPSTCSRCGGSNLPAECRTGSVTRSCAEYPATCKFVDPECKSGVVAAVSVTDTTPAFCCDADCKQCGGTGCSSAGTGCCTGSIAASCDVAMPPCAL